MTVDEALDRLGAWQAGQAGMVLASEVRTRRAQRERVARYLAASADAGRRTVDLATVARLLDIPVHTMIREDPQS